MNLTGFALITCSDRPPESLTWFKRLIKFLKQYIRKTDNELFGSIQVIDIGNGLAVHFVTLPYSREELLKFEAVRARKALIPFIDYLARNSISKFIFSKYLYDISAFADFKESKSGFTVFSALMTHVIDEIYTKNGIDINSLDIVVIPGESQPGLFTVLKQLMYNAKYLAVISDDSWVSAKADEIFTETGLSIMVTTDFKSVLKNADLIINLGRIPDTIRGIRIKPTAVILNYGDQNSFKHFYEGILIRGITVRLPAGLQHKLGKLVCESFSSIQLAETIICLKLNLNNGMLPGSDESGMLDKIREEFIRGGYNIDGLIGRHTTLTKEEMKAKLKKIIK